MPTTILLIENDVGFAREITESLEGAGYQVRVTGDGKEGLDLAKEVAPAAIVLCVELPRMSGYSICQKLKKDDALRGIPLILTSAEATAETFEQHKKLKARAEEYLLKPYTAASLLAVLAPFTGQPEAPAAAEEPGEEPGEEEVVSLEEELGLEMLPGEGELPALDLASLPDEPVPGGGEPLAVGGEDEDLRLLDDAFAGLSGGGARPAPTPVPAPRPVEEQPRDPGAELDLALEAETPVAAAEVDAADASLPPEVVAPDPARLESVADEADLALGALGGDDPASAGAAIDALDALPAAAEPPPAARPPDPPAFDFAPELAAALDLAPDAPAAHVRGASVEALRAAGIALVDEGPASPPPALKVVPPPSPEPAAGAAAGHLEAQLADRHAALAARDAELRELQDRLDALTHRAVDAESALAGKEAEAAAAQARAEALAAQLRRAEADLKAGREEARKAADALRAAEDRARAAEGQAGAAADKARVAEDRARAADERADGAERRASAAESKAAAADGKAATAVEKARAAETLAAAAEAKALAAAAEAAKQRAAAARLEEVERELEELKTELIVARGEVEGARSEVEKRGAELKRRISELESANGKNEERVVKAYLKIKGDEKVRDKARKALAIALQLLEEGLPPEAPAAPRSPAAGAAKLE